MGIHYNQSNIHWNYFLAIESDFEKISRYIEFTEANNKTFSIELARIIMGSAQEIDGIMKKLCPLIVVGSNPQKINEYRDIIKDDLPNFIIEEVQIPRFGMTSKPWINWNDNQQDNSPLWWKANNKIKHDRTQNFEKANLKNAYNAVGALLITTLYYYKLQIQSQNSNQAISWQDLTSQLKPKSSLLILKDEYYHESGFWSLKEW
jgi:hypothetical protein